ncbi:MAG: hypothetical protein ABUT39_26340 [Acidobacteriota bacterium]
MDHSYIDDHQVVELYLQGKLPPEEAALFEEHSMSCSECLDRLETAEKLRLGLRAVAAREVAAEAVRVGLLARLMRSRLAPLALTALFLVAVLPAGLLWRRAGRLEGELSQTREQLRQEISRPAPASTPDPEVGALRSRLDEQSRQAEAARQERDRLAAELEKAASPRANVPVVPLSPERAAPGAAPSTRISLASSPEILVLLLELDATDFPSYQATLTGGQTSWNVSGLRPDSQGTLTLALPAARLQPGDFTVRVEGLPAHGKPAPVASFSFRVVR